MTEVIDGELESTNLQFEMISVGIVHFCFVPDHKAISRKGANSFSWSISIVTFQIQVH